MLIELIIVIGIIGVLVALVIPSYSNFMQEGENSTAVADIVNIQEDIMDFFLDRGRFPDTLEEAGFTALDPWGNPYEYLNFASQKGKGNGKKRKDKNLVPINSDYDLYSKGEDGRSVGPLTAKHSRDDIIRANNGAFVGLAEEY